MPRRAIMLPCLYPYAKLISNTALYSYILPH